MCYDGVGTANEFSYGTIRVQYGNESSFLLRVKSFVDGKEYENYDREQMRSQVRDWREFVKDHDDVFEGLA
jgi:hypothetical protein